MHELASGQEREIRRKRLRVGGLEGQGSHDTAHVDALMLPAGETLLVLPAKVRGDSAHGCRLFDQLFEIDIQLAAAVEITEARQTPEQCSNQVLEGQGRADDAMVANPCRRQEMKPEPASGQAKSLPESVRSHCILRLRKCFAIAPVDLLAPVMAQRFNGFQLELSTTGP